MMMVADEVVIVMIVMVDVLMTVGDGGHGNDGASCEGDDSHGCNDGCEVWW